MRDEVNHLAFALNFPANRHHAGGQAIGRCVSNSDGQTTRLAMPVSSSMVMNMTPLALPGRWRTRTTPAASSRRLFGVDAANDSAGNLPAMPGIFPDYPAPIVRNGARKARELAMARWGMRHRSELQSLGAHSLRAAFAG
jgi:hypothetical protein